MVVPSSFRPPIGPSVVLLASLAGGMGWGIRGQYGHQTGAAVPGALVALALALVVGRGRSALDVARIAALTAIGIAFGGSMTYGQTIGLTQDRELIGNWSALSWGMLGLAIKGGIWVGLAGAFLGVGLRARQFRPVELGLIFASLIALSSVGVALLNQPYQPAQKVLPPLYFSATWDWFPNKPDPKPRFENWGGLLLGWIGLTVYLARVRRLHVAGRLAGAGFLAGALGFPGGQVFQASHAWNREWFQTGPFGAVDPLMNWWNVMEITFGLVLGAGLGLGVWLQRRAIETERVEDEQLPEHPGWGTNTELAVALTVAFLMVCWEFLEIAQISEFADLAFPFWMLPALAVLSGRIYPYLHLFPLLALPIGGKTFRRLCLEENRVPDELGGVLFLLLPALVTLGAVLLAVRRNWTGPRFAAMALLTTAGLHYALNFAFFDFPWFWLPPTGRTPSALLFSAVLAVLSVAAWRVLSARERAEAESEGTFGSGP